MATRKINFTEWLKLVARHGLDDQFANVAGYPAAEVATRLDVSRERVGQLVREGVLDTLEITTRRGNATALVLITEASIDRYLARRVPDRNRQGYFAFQE